MPTASSLHWFRDDLRLGDNPALSHAAAQGSVVAVYVFDDETPGLRGKGAASNWWLHHSLERLAESLSQHGVQLVLRQGKAERVIADLAAQCGCQHVTWNRQYGAAEIARDTAIKTNLRELGLDVESFNARVLHEPMGLRNKSGGVFKVFSPYWKALSALPQADALPVPALSGAGPLESMQLADFKLTPKNPDWSEGWSEIWSPGEAGAHLVLESRRQQIMEGYGEDRNIPGVEGTSRLSPHLVFGEISPRQIWHHYLDQMNRQPGGDKNTWAFLREIGWRDFSHYLLFHFPHLATDNWRHDFDAFPWADAAGDASEDLTAWQRGQTGFPIVDAGLRELWQTGWMHNRVRMIVASFLIKHLLIDWREGERWFWDTLLDACPANNPAGWQWVAGSGADASPYFRIFNPMTQGEKFDPEGEYIKRWVPELKRLPAPFVHQPWEAPALVLIAAEVELGATYPRPLVDHKFARQRALDAFATIKKQEAFAA